MFLRGELDASAMPVRDTKRRGEKCRPDRPTSGGPMAWGGTSASACSSLSTRRGDHRLLLRVRLHQSSAIDRDLLRPAHEPDPRATSVGSAAAGPYVTDKGFDEGEENHRRGGSSATERV